jgi:hypothetical protein
MVIKIDKKTTEESLTSALERMTKDHAKRKNPNLAEFFGIWPDIGDGLEFQKKVRNEWK